VTTICDSMLLVRWLYAPMGLLSLLGIRQHERFPLPRTQSTVFCVKPEPDRSCTSVGSVGTVPMHFRARVPVVKRHYDHVALPDAIIR